MFLATNVATGACDIDALGKNFTLSSHFFRKNMGGYTLGCGAPALNIGNK